MQNCYEYFIEAISTQEVALSYLCRHVFSHFLDTYTTPIFLHLMDGLIFFILTQFDLAFQPSFWYLILQTLLICGSRKGCLLLEHAVCLPCLSIKGDFIKPYRRVRPRQFFSIFCFPRQKYLHFVYYYFYVSPIS